jgi:hypothetical protein
MKKYIIVIIVISICLWFNSISFAQVGMKKVGQSTMNFLKVGISPKAAAMGNTYTATGNDIESIFYNPAGLAGVTDLSAFAARTQWIADINYNAAAIGIEAGYWGTFALSFLSVDYGDITGATLLSETDPKGYRELGNIDVGAYAFGLAYARQISDQFSIGGQIQYVNQKLGETELLTNLTENSLSKLAFSFGVKYLTGYKKFRFAMAIRNFATSAEYEEVSAQLPLVFTVGAGIDVLEFVAPGHSGESFIFSAEFLHPNNYTERVNIGGEYKIFGLIALRSGYEFNRDLGGLSAGFGLFTNLNGNKLELNYSYSDFDVFDAVNRFSINVSF